MDKQKKSELKICLFYGFFLVGMFLVFVGTHNIDNAWNMRTTEDMVGGDWVDCNLVSCWDSGKLYMVGLDTLIFGVVLLSVDIIFILINLTKLKI